jgi:hypothetical protein
MEDKNNISLYFPHESGIMRPSKSLKLPDYDIGDIVYFFFENGYNMVAEVVGVNEDYVEIGRAISINMLTPPKKTIYCSGEHTKRIKLEEIVGWKHANEDEKNKLLEVYGEDSKNSFQKLYSQLIPYVEENFITIPLWEEGSYKIQINLWAKITSSNIDTYCKNLTDYIKVYFSFNEKIDITVSNTRSKCFTPPLDSIMYLVAINIIWNDLAKNNEYTNPIPLMETGVEVLNVIKSYQKL